MLNLQTGPRISFNTMNIIRVMYIVVYFVRVFRYEVRVVIWNCADVVFDEKNVFGEAMSDVYVKGYFQGQTDSQKTDVHYRY